MEHQEAKRTGRSAADNTSLQESVVSSINRVDWCFVQLARGSAIKPSCWSHSYSSHKSTSTSSTSSTWRADTRSRSPQELFPHQTAVWVQTAQAKVRYMHADALHSPRVQFIGTHPAGETDSCTHRPRKMTRKITTYKTVTKGGRLTSNSHITVPVSPPTLLQNRWKSSRYS